LSIALSGVGVAGMIVLPTVIHIVEFFGWREAYLFMSFLILFVSLPAVAFLLVEQPRHQTETRVQKAGKSSNPGRQIKGLNLNGTLKTSCFWKILFTFFCLGLASIGVVSHLVPMLTIRGILASEIAVLFSVGGAALIFGRVLCGYMLDHYHAPVVTSLFISALAIASWMLADGYQGFTLMLIIVVLINISIGAEFDLIAYLTSRYFGIKSYGSIYGLIFSGFYAGAGIGSWFLGRVFDNSGSYIFGLWVLSGVLILAILSVIRLGPYSFFNVEKQNV
jgi:predicted MFS family arabinose efflux permease